MPAKYKFTWKKKDALEWHETERPFSSKESAELFAISLPLGYEYRIEEDE